MDSATFAKVLPYFRGCGMSKVRFLAGGFGVYPDDIQHVKEIALEVLKAASIPGGNADDREFPSVT